MEAKMADNETSRRKFIRQIAIAAAGVMSLSAAGSCAGETRGNKSGSKTPTPGASKAATAGKPIVVVARDPALRQGGKLDSERVKNLLFRAVRALTNKPDDKAAWISLFSGASIVGLKLNCISGRKLSSTPEVALAIAEGLFLSGIKHGDVIAWDRTEKEVEKAGFTLGHNSSGINCTGTDSPDFGYDSELSISGEAGSLVSRIASSFCDALVNVPVLKDHDLTGVTGSLKNYFGAIHNPNKMHENGCDPYIADLYSLPVFKNKTRLIVCDGTTAQYHGGPSYKSRYAWNFSGLIVSTDPVAADTVQYKIIKEKRASAGLPTLEKEGRPPKYLSTAGQRNLGENRIDRIKIIEI